MRGNKFEKSHIHILESETLSRESRITETAQEIDDSIAGILDPISTYVNTYILICGEERRRIERRMSRCFTWFPIGGYRWTQYIPEFGGSYKNRGFYLEGIWLWRIKWGLFTGDDGVKFSVYSTIWNAIIFHQYFTSISFTIFYLHFEPTLVTIYSDTHYFSWWTKESFC